MWVNMFLSREFCQNGGFIVVDGPGKGQFIQTCESLSARRTTLQGVVAMTVRAIVIALGLAGAVLAPAGASARADDTRSGPGAIAKKLDDPGAQVAAAASLAVLAEKMLDIDIAPYVRAIDA